MRNITKNYNLDKNTSLDLSCDLLKHFKNNKPIIICLGSDKVLSDCVGVLVAEMLKKCNISTYVLGGADLQVMSNNIDCILQKFPNSKFLFIDSCLSAKKNTVIFNNNCIKLGSGKTYCGASITASTIIKNKNKILLAESKLKDVFKLSKVITNAIVDFFYYLNYLKCDVC